MTIYEERHYMRLGHEAEYIKKCIITFKLDDCKFSPKQRDRFLFLVSQRYNPKTGIVRFAMKRFQEFEHNKNKAIEMLQETLLEAYRAPQD